MPDEDDTITTLDNLRPHERLRLLRERAAIRQADFALQLGVTQSTISHWEGGSSEPSARNRLHIVAILGTDPYSCDTCGR